MSDYNLPIHSFNLTFSYSSEMINLYKELKAVGYISDIINNNVIYVYVGDVLVQFKKPSKYVMQRIPWVGWLYRINNFSWNHAPSDGVINVLYSISMKIYNGYYTKPICAKNTDDDSETGGVFHMSP